MELTLLYLGITFVVAQNLHDAADMLDMLGRVLLLGLLPLVTSAPIVSAP